MSADDVISRLAAWATTRPDLVALVQIGSRVQPGAEADAWSDYDFQLITSQPGAYRHAAAFAGLGEAWVFAVQPVFGGADKVTLIGPDAVEMDFVLLPAARLRIAFAALRFPGLSALWPAPLRVGVRDLRIVACPGWRVLKGGAAWEHRYARLGAAVPWPPLREEDFHARVAAFWAAAVWTAKKTLRGEYRAAQRELHRTLAEHLFALLEEEARAAGVRARPEARRAETWLAPERLRETALVSAPERTALATSLRAMAAHFDATADRLAASQGWSVPDHAAARAWVQSQLG